jgi:hypothetical protein
MKGKLLAIALIFSTLLVHAQQLLLIDRFNGNKIVNDSTITLFSSDMNIFYLTQYFTIKNNTDRPLALFLRKTVNVMNDSTSDYFCFGVKCWPDTDTTDIADSIQPGAEDYNFASHVTHVRRFDLPQPLLPPGLSSITYTIFDHTSFSEPVEASVTVVYHLSGVGIEDEETGRQGDKGTGRGEAVVYPNPASERLTVETGENEPGKYTLLIYSSLGIQVQKSILYLNERKLTIPVHFLPEGLYFGRIVPERGTGITFRFQVAR